MQPITRRRFVQQALTAGAAFTIVPRHVLGGDGMIPPSETLGAAVIGCGGRSSGTYEELANSLKASGFGVTKLAECDVQWVGRPNTDNKTRYTDFRRVIERKDIDVVAIATPPHWHPLISIAAMEAGKDVLCEKPMGRFIAEGRAVADTAKRYNRIFQIGTFGRFGQPRQVRKIVLSGLLQPNPGVIIHRGGLKVKEWSGLVNAKPRPVPANLDWEMYCGPSPLRPYHPHRVGGTHRGYWDYEGGGLCDMAQHALDPITYRWGIDGTAPIEATPNTPPAHQDVCGMWGWVELKYADGLTLVLDSAEWGEPWEKKKPRDVTLDDLTPEDREKLKAMPDPEPLLNFGQAVRQRKPAGGNAEAAHRTVTIIHLANIAIRVGRKIKFDPIKEVIIGDEQANRLVNPPMRSPWHV
jgi:myo-inositol 2-dehydrogenase / D-chiro-inositol 1-dehydrogenase